jgi:hypothetical protein
MSRARKITDLYERVEPIKDPDAFRLVIDAEADDYVLADLRDRFWNGQGEKPWQVKEINRLLTRRKEGRVILPGSTASVPSAQSPASATGFTFPDKVTISWLYHHIPVPIWVTLAGLITAAFIGGVTSGQTTFVRELLGKATPAMTTPERPKLSSEELKTRVDQLVHGHNESIKNLYTAIANEEKEAGQKYYTSEQQPHIDAAKRLKETLRQENERFEQQLRALKELEQ